MKHKTEYTQNTLESSSQTSSGVTAWLSMADRGSPVPGVSIFRITDMSTYIRCLCRDPGGGQRRVINRTDPIPVHVGYSPTELPDENGYTQPRCAQAPCMGITHYPLFFFFWLV